MLENAYTERRGRIETYFDLTARDAWAQLTSDAPVSKIRATVRAGRDRMRTLLVDWLGADLNGKRLLDAGCGTGALANEAAIRGADVVAVDVSANLINVARERTPEGRSIDYHAGDMLDPALGAFDHVVAMDSLIHYEPADAVAALTALAARTNRSIVFTFAPRTAASTAMHAVGRFFPRADRAPSIVPVSEATIRDRLASLKGWRVARTERVVSGFYLSQAMELVRT
jgi:magnesium-protoporphyrin O-methyltransferase